MAKVKITGHASGTGILTVTAPNTSTDRTITLPDATGTLLNSDGSGASLTGLPLVNPNIIINGAMNVAQRSTSATGITSNSYNACDRWKLQINDAGTFTMAQEALTSGAAYEAGFGFATRLDCTTADASVAAGSYLYLKHMIEGQDLIQLSKGTSSARAFTVSFWVKTTTTGVYQLSVRDQNTRMCTGTYTVSSADTWEQKTITIAADTSGAIANSSAEGLALEFWLAAGSNYTSGTAPTAWEAKADTDRAASLSHQMSSATSKDWAITGVKMELGSTATDFEHRSYAEELALCHRYFQETSTYSIYAGFSNGSAQVQYGLPLTVPMRAAPSVTWGGSSSNSTALKHNGSSDCADSNVAVVSHYGDNAVDIHMYLNGFSGLSDMYITNISPWAKTHILAAEL